MIRGRKLVFMIIAVILLLVAVLGYDILERTIINISEGERYWYR